MKTLDKETKTAATEQPPSDLDAIYLSLREYFNYEDEVQ